MQQFVDNLIGRLEEINPVDYGSSGSYEAHYAVKDCLRDVKEAVNQLAEEYKYKTDWQSIYDKVVSLEYEYAKEGKENAVNDCIRLENFLQFFKEKLQSAEEYKGGWISVKDRLPEVHQKVLITYQSKRAVGVNIGYISIYDRKWHYNRGDLVGSKIIAWMPLPEPYQKEGE